MSIHVILAFLLQLTNRIIVEAGYLHKLHVVLLSHFFALVIMLTYYLFKYFASASSFSLHCCYLKYHISRGLAYAVAQVLLIYAYSHFPFVKVSAITLAYPIFAAIGGVLFLGSKMGAVRSISTVVGLLGAMIIVNPSPSDFDIYSLYVILAVVIWVVFDVLTSKLGNREDFHVEFFYLFIFQFLFCATLSTGITIPSEILNIVWDFRAIIFWSIMGLGVLLYSFTWLAAIRYAELISIAPLYFCTLILGVFASYYVFNEPISSRVIFGSILIIISVSIIAVREYRARKLLENDKRGIS